MEKIHLLFAFAVSFLTVILITPFVIRLMQHLHIVDDPSIHKHPGIIHHRPIPRGGSIALFAGVFISVVLFIPNSAQIIGVLTASGIALLVGIYDDLLNARARDLSPYIRFATNIICALIVVGSGVKINFITNPFDTIFHLEQLFIPLTGFIQISLADISTIVWIVWVMNMLNWSKGVDGQMPGIVGISALVIALLGIRTASNSSFLIDSTLALSVAGSAFGFIIYNFYPAKIFPGYGATSIYLLVAVASILSSAKLATAILVMGVPMVDAVFTVMRRILSGRSPFWHDNKHLHHLLLQAGFRQRSIALSYWIFSAILGSISLLLDSKSKAFALVMVGVIVGGGLLFLHLSTHPRHEKNTA
jgi:UDP-GlcNAc:undecaprenyl-phosphate GlcNAc-1-phosphate transferase